MTATPIELSTKQTPIACSLSATDASSQLDEWVELRSHALSTTALAEGIRLSLPLQLVDTAQDLAARERACCSFLTITVTAGDAQVDVDITSADLDGQRVVAALAGLA